MTERKLLELPDITREKATLRVIGAGASFPFRFSDLGAVRAVEISKGLDKINQSIRVILATRKGERVNRPTFGCFAGETEIFVHPGRKVPISELTQESRVHTLGTVLVPGTRTNPPAVGFTSAFTEAAVSRGVRPVVRLRLSNGAEVRCTPDHHFLLRDYKTYQQAGDLVTGERLGWIDTSIPSFGARLYSRRQSHQTPMGHLPCSTTDLWVSSVEMDGETEVFDLVNSSTSNYLLASGPIVHNSNLPKLVFEPNDDILIPLLRKETADALRIWEKRIRITQVECITPASLSLTGLYDDPTLTNEIRNLARDTSTIGIFIQYIVLRTSQPGSYVFPFKRETNRWGYNVPEL